jgi:hypothetical protein
VTPVAKIAAIIAGTLAIAAATPGLAPAWADVEDQIGAEKFHIIRNQGVDTEQLTAYLGQAHGVSSDWDLACETKAQPKPHAFSSPKQALPMENQRLTALLNPPEVQ